MNQLLTYFIVGMFLLLSIRVKAIDKTKSDKDSLKIEWHNGYLPKKYREIGSNIFLGYGMLNGNISNYITNPIFLGCNGDFHLRRLVLQMDAFLGFGKVKKTMEFLDGSKWSKNKAVLNIIGGGNLGYTLKNSRSIRIVPLAGIGFTSLTSTFLGSSENQDNEPFLPYYKLGCYVDLKSLKLFRNNEGFNSIDRYTCIRLSFGLHTPIGKAKYSEFFSGNMIYFTIGMGALGK